MEKRCALCIGNNHYQFLSPLMCAINDADEMGAAFRRLGYKTSVFHDLERSEMGSRIFDFAERIKDYDVCIFYYAGHGFDVKGQNLLIPVDFEYDLAKSDEELIYSAFSLNDLLKLYYKYPDKAKLIILDACRNTGNIRGGSSGFSPVMSPKGSLVAFSTSPGETAWEVDDNNTKHGRYTNTLLKYIDADLRVEDLFKKVRQVMDVETQGRQIPWEHTSLMGHLSLNNRYNQGKVIILNYIDSLKITCQKRSEVLYVGSQDKEKKLDINYPMLEANNPHVSQRTSGVIRIQDAISYIYKTMEQDSRTLLNSMEQEIEKKFVLESGNTESLKVCIGYEVFLNAEGIFCICISRDLNAEGFQGMPGKVIKVFDINTGNELSLRNVMNNSDSEILDLIQSRFEQEKQLHPLERPKIDANFCLGNYNSLDELKWYLNENGIYIYFDIREADNSEGYIDFLLSDEVYYEDPIKGKIKLDLNARVIKEKMIAKLVANYESTYTILLNRTIGSYYYDIMAMEVTPARPTTFWLIKCLKYKNYDRAYLEEMIDELIRMKLNYEILAGRRIIAILQIVWNEEQENEMINICRTEFSEVVNNNYHIEDVYLEYLMGAELT